MKIQRKLFIWIHWIFMSVIGNFVSIHGGSWDFDTSTEVYITIAQMICECFKILLFYLCAIISYVVMNRKSSSNSCFMRNKEEVKYAFSLSLHQTSINTCAWSWVNIPISISIVFFEESVGNSFVNKAIHNLWSITLCEAIDRNNHLFQFFIHYFVYHWRTS